jgi:hypothetical protein
VKHKRKINRVFSEVCGDKSFPLRRPGRKLKIPAVAVAICSVAPPKAPRRRSSKSGLAAADETTSCGVQPTKTKSLESSKCKHKSSEQISDAELQAASSLAQMSCKKSKKVVKFELLKFGGFHLLSTTTSSWSQPARKVLTSGPC